MNSFRLRLILGLAVVALVPLALVTVFLSQRVQSSLRADAAGRLSATLGLVRRRLAADGDDLSAKLDVLAHDPALRRLYLLEAAEGQDLSDFVAEKRFLLGLDFLQVADPVGHIVADGTASLSERTRGLAEPIRVVGVGVADTAAARIATLADGHGFALAAAAAIPYQNRISGVLRGGVALDRGFLARLKETSGVDLVLRDARGRPVASTLADSSWSPLPNTAAAARTTIRGEAFLVATVPASGLPGQGAAGATLTGLVSTAGADATMAELWRAAALFALAGLALAIVLGTLWSRQVSRPLEEVARFSQRIAVGEWDEPLAMRGAAELQTLARALERMRTDLGAYRERLRASERHAAWGQMARKVAHEVKNPLTPIAISVADLKRSFQQQRPDFPEILDSAVRTIDAEIRSLTALLDEFSNFGRLPSPVFAVCRPGELLADLAGLYAREVAESRLVLAPVADDVAFAADRGQVRQALINLVKNGLEATPSGGRVEVSARRAGNSIAWSVADDGPGLSEADRARLFAPEFTTKPGGSGLGLTIVERIVHDHGGTVRVESTAGRGTVFHILLPLEREA